MSKIVLIASFLVCSNLYLLLAQTDDELINILKTELEREMKELAKQEYPPYFMEYRVDENSSTEITAFMGSLIESTGYKSRALATTVKVGDYDFDNTHPLNGDNAQENFNYGVIPVENDPKAINQYLWLFTDAAYKQAREQFLSLQNNYDKSEEKEVIPDFSKQEPSVFIEPAYSASQIAVDKELWEMKLKKITAPFADYDSIFDGTASLNFTYHRKYLVSSEGSMIAENYKIAQLIIQGSILAADGNKLNLSNVYYENELQKLPAEEQLLKETEELIAKLKLLQKAPKADPYAGPAILSNEVTGVFFHEIFGHRVEGHRLTDKMDGQTFKARLGKKVLPKFIDVVFDPTVDQYRQFNLMGHYHYDDQGVKSEKVVVVEDGELQQFLMSRHPVNQGSRSNGHGRSAAGYNPVARQSNMIVETSKPRSEKDLRKMLIKECKKQNKEYGYYIKKVTGGFTATDRYQPNVFNIEPTEVYRVYVDGRADELVRGVDLIGTPLTMFSEIEATGNEYGIFNGYCGAESGFIPVSAVAPTIFVKKIETQRQVESQFEMPILPNPALYNHQKNDF
ncbi:MAG: metallopeptidase TldD-related protein [Cyclobacteriaceae bacterium]